MAQLKKKKYPKKPKSTASVQVKENYLKRVDEIKKENKKIEAENSKSKALTKKIAAVGRA